MPDIQETLSHAIGLLGDDVLKRSKLLINVIEDMNPCLNDDIRFLRKVYSDEVGRLLFRSRQDGFEKEKYLSELSDYLINECGYNDDWKNRFVSIFMFLFEINKPHDPTNRITNNDMKKVEETPAKKYDRAAAYYEAGQTDEAIRVLEQIRDRAVYEAKAQLLLGDIFETDSQKSFGYYLNAANLGEVKAQIKLGVMYEEGKKLELDNIKAFQWFEKAAKQGDADAQYKLARMYRGVLGIEKDAEKQLEWYEKAAGQGNVEAQYDLGSHYRFSRKYEKAFMWYSKAAEQGNINAQMQLAMLYRDGDGIGKDYKKAMEWYMKAAAQGHGNAQLWIGYMYFSGMGIEKNYEKAMEWYEKAVTAEKFNPIFFESVLGYMRIKGNKKDIVEALEWYEKAAEHGCARIQAELGDIYHGVSFRTGNGGIVDYKKSLEWYQKAAAQGDARAQYRMGDMYYLGEGIERDYAKALLLYEKAAEQLNITTLLFRLGNMYEKGEGTKKDINAALDWYRKEAKAGGLRGKKKLREYNVS